MGDLESTTLQRQAWKDAEDLKNALSNNKDETMKNNLINFSKPLKIFDRKKMVNYNTGRVNYIGFDPDTKYHVVSYCLSEYHDPRLGYVNQSDGSIIDTIYYVKNILGSVWVNVYFNETTGKVTTGIQTYATEEAAKDHKCHISPTNAMYIKTVEIDLEE